MVLVLFETSAGYAVFKVRTLSVHVGRAQSFRPIACTSHRWHRRGRTELGPGLCAQHPCVPITAYLRGPRCSRRALPRWQRSLLG